MAELYERIAQLCKSEGVTVTEMCKQSGASRGSLTDLKMGRINSLSLETLSKIATFFKIDIWTLVEYQTVTPETKKAPTVDGEGITKEQIKIALFGDDAGDISDEDLDNAVQFARFSARERKQRGDNK